MTFSKTWGACLDSYSAGFLHVGSGSNNNSNSKSKESEDPEERKQEVHTPVVQNTTYLGAVLHNNMLSPLRLLPVEKLISYSP